MPPSLVRREITRGTAGGVRIDPRGNAAAAHELGRRLKERGDLEEAEAAFRRADERGHAAAAYELGFRLEVRGDLEGAEVAYLRAVEAGDFQVAQQASAAHKSLRRKSGPDAG